MTTATREVLGYIKRLCKKIVPGVFGMKVSRRGQWKRIKPRVGSENDDITVVDLSLRDRIKFLKHRLKQEVRSEVINGVITIDISEQIAAFMRSKKGDGYLQLILKSHTRKLLQQQFKKTEDPDLMLLERNASLKGDLKKVQLEKEEEEREKDYYQQEYDMATDDVVTLKLTIAELQNSLQQNQISLQNKDEVISRLLKRLASYGHGVKLDKLSDYELQGVGMMIEVGTHRWKAEHAKREAAKELHQMHDCACPIILKRELHAALEKKIFASCKLPTV